jgi:hypothetical protein
VVDSGLVALAAEAGRAADAPVADAGTARANVVPAVQ